MENIETKFCPEHGRTFRKRIWNGKPEWSHHIEGNQWHNEEIINDSSPTPKPPVPAFKSLANKLNARNDSIEVQVAIKEVGECYRAGKFGDENPSVKLYFRWIMSRLSSCADGDH